MYYVYGAHVKGELLVIMKNSQIVKLLIFISNTLIELLNVLEGSHDPARTRGSTTGYQLVSVEVLRPVPTGVPQSIVKVPRPVKHVVNKAHSPIRRPINHKQATKHSNFNKQVTTIKVNKGNPQKALKDKGVTDSGCSRHMTGNIYYLSDFKEINGGYVAFGRNPKGGKITCKGDLTCLFANATLDESNLWHRRLGHINFKTMNKHVKGNLVRGLPSKIFENNHICVACKKGKQHRASCKSNPISSVSHPLQRLHMDLFGPTFVKSLNKKSYCPVVTDDYSRRRVLFSVRNVKLELETKLDEQAWKQSRFFKAFFLIFHPSYIRCRYHVIRKTMEGNTTNQLKEVLLKNPHNGNWEALTTSKKSILHTFTGHLKCKLIWFTQ
nr:ribonuclease H-like domain-containing protein [Tanacetum cinerariifolium]